MPQPKVGVFDYVVVVVILLISIIIGLYHGYRKQAQAFLARIVASVRGRSSKIDSIEMRKNSGIEAAGEPENQLSEYLTANASMGAIPLGFSLLATFFSSTTIIGTPAEIYQYGVQNWIVTFGFALVPPSLAAFVTGPFFASLNIISVFEYIELRYQAKWVRMMSMSCYVVRNFISSAVFTLGPSTALSLLMDLDQNVSIALIIAIGTFYTCIGGIKAVIWTDLFQAVIMFSSVGVIVVKGAFFDSGGLTNLWQVNEAGGRLNFFEVTPDPFVRQSFWTLIIGGTM
jgi:Na+/proline symporter